MKIACMLPAGYGVLVADESQAYTFEQELKKTTLNPGNARSEIDRVIAQLGYGEAIETINFEEVKWEPMRLTES